jgi:hypothetical protein
VILMATKWVDLSSSGIGRNWLGSSEPDSIGLIETSKSSESESLSESLSESVPFESALAPSASSNLDLSSLGPML